MRSIWSKGISVVSRKCLEEWESWRALFLSGMLALLVFPDAALAAAATTSTKIGDFVTHLTFARPEPVQ